MTSPHPDDVLADLVDGRLDDAASADLRAHLAGCEACRAVHDDLVAARAAARMLRHEPEMPADLLASVGRALDAAGDRAPDARRDGPDRPGATRPGSPALASPTGKTSMVSRWWRPAAAAAALLVAVAGYLLVVGRGPAIDLPGEAAGHLQAIESRRLALAVRTTDPVELERFFSSAGVPVRVIDLAMMRIGLQGGLAHTLGGHRAALYSYQTAEGRLLVCQMFEGRLEELPPPSETRDANGFRFQVYTRGSVTLVFWQEGDLVCVLASDLPAVEVIELAIAKAMAPA